MKGRGRSILINSVETELRRPGSASSPEIVPVDNDVNVVDRLMLKVTSISSPDDLLVHSLSAEIKNTINDADTLSQLITRLCDHGLQNSCFAAIVGAICGPISQHGAENVKLRVLLLKRLQTEFGNKDEIAIKDRRKFLTSAVFLGEIFHNVKSESGSSFVVLAPPLIQYLSMILSPHFETESLPEVNEEMDIIAHQILQNGHALLELQHDKMCEIIQSLTEVLCRHNLATSTKLNLLAALADIWPHLSSRINPRTTHAALAAKLGCSLHV